MSMTLIQVNWTNAKEVLAIDLKALRTGVPVTSTTETQRGGPPYSFNTTSTFERTDDGGSVLTITYREQDNAHLSSQEPRWGHATYEFDASETNGTSSLTEGTAHWEDDSDPYYTGEGDWQIYSGKDALVSDSELKQISAKARRQARMRKRLLQIDPRCAITGEIDSRVLEAAHVIPKAKNGADVEANGIMLRSDLHRLFDAGAFRFKGDGSVVIAKDANLSPDYTEALKGASISRETMARVKNAFAVKKSV